MTYIPTGRPRGRPKKTDTALHTLQSGPFDIIAPKEEIVAAGLQQPESPPSPPPSDLREPMRPKEQGVHSSAERHRLRAAEEYPMDDFEGSKFYIERPLKPGEHKLFPQGRQGDYPAGFDLQWVGITVWGQHQPQIEAEFARKGWEPVHHGDFDGRYDGRFLPRSHVGPIIVDGLMLVARPMAWSDKARSLASREAHNRVAIKVGQLKAGELDGVTLNPQHKHLGETNYVNVDVETVSTPKTG